MENKNIIILIGFLLSVGGWFLWNIILSAAFQNVMRIYQIRHAFLQNFGRTLSFWTTILLALAAVICLELVVDAIRRVYWPRDVDLMQRLERKGLNENDRETGQGDASGTVLEVVGDKTFKDVEGGVWPQVFHTPGWKG
ncbi:phospholipid-translocating P-type ATPase [Colletotrichum higginsianum]|nr:phospholipid-translocating P-type ATPase [Colletotrichum higginsianum]